MNINCKTCCVFMCCYPYEYFNQIRTQGFPLCASCNNCMDCGNYVCSCVRCCDCWLTMEICRCDNDPHCYTNIATSREREMLQEIDDEIMEDDLIHSLNNQFIISDPIDDLSTYQQQVSIYK